jgi:hypothetical protein
MATLGTPSPSSAEKGWENDKMRRKGSKWAKIGSKWGKNEQKRVKMGRNLEETG